MASIAKGTTKASGAKSAIEPGSEMSDLAALLVATNRIGDALQSAAAEQQTGIAVTDWLLLRTLDREGPLSMSKTAAKIGISRQRVHQQSAALEAMGAISIARGEDKKSRILTIALGGRALIEMLDEAFRATLSDDQGALPATPIHTAKVSTGRIQKLLASKRVPKPEGVAA